jgi:hypothetical protein
VFRKGFLMLLLMKKNGPQWVGVGMGVVGEASNLGRRIGGLKIPIPPVTYCVCTFVVFIGNWSLIGLENELFAVLVWAELRLAYSKPVPSN